MISEAELQAARQANGGKLRAAFEQARDNPGFRVVVVTRLAHDLSVQMSDLALEFKPKKLNRTERFIQFENGSWIQFMRFSDLPHRIKGWRADLVLCDTRADFIKREWLLPVISDAKRPGVIKPFSIILEAV